MFRLKESYKNVPACRQAGTWEFRRKAASLARMDIVEADVWQVMGG